MEALDPFLPLPGMTLADWRPDSPTHSPAWRWLRARWLHEMKKRVSSHFDDPFVVGARDFLAGQARPATARGRRKPVLPDPAIRAALELARDPGPPRRGELEAYLLTAESFIEIGRRLDLSTAVVMTYHSLFFAVRDRPQERDWIARYAVGSGPWNDHAGPHPVGTWKYGAFSGGARLLELLIAITADRPLPAWIRKTCGTRADEYEGRLRLIAGHTIPDMLELCRAHVEQLVVLHDRLERIEQQASSRDEFETVVMRARTLLREVFREHVGS